MTNQDKHSAGIDDDLPRQLVAKADLSAHDG
jgi:hypothetical protein